ncbi:hypothetical protein OQA88_11505 [Cercophora sp. LCS_1]
MSNYIPGGGSREPEDNAKFDRESLLAQLRNQSSPSPGPGAGPDSHQYGYGQGAQSYYGHHSNADSPSLSANFQTDSPAFLPEAPTPPVGFGSSQYPPGLMNPIGTGRGPAGDVRSAHLLNILKFNSQGGSSGPQRQSSHDAAVSFQPAPIAPPIIQAPKPAAADPTGLLAALMKGTLQAEPSKPETPAAATWNQNAPPSSDTQQYLLNLLNRPKPSQNDAPEAQPSSLLTPPPGDDEPRDGDAHRSAEPTLVDAIPSQSEFEYDAKDIESPHPKFNSTPHSQHSQAISTSRFSAHGSSHNPFEDHSGTSPVHRTPASTTPGASGAGHAQAGQIQILRKPDSAQSTHDQKRPLSDRGSLPSPEHTRRKIEHASSPLSQTSASRPAHMNASPFSDASIEHRLSKPTAPVDGDKKESVADAVSGLAEQADREAREALARRQDEQTQAEIAQDLHNMIDARTDAEFSQSAQTAAQAIKKELDKEENKELLGETLTPEMAQEVHNIVEETATASHAVADSWESADADEIVVIEEPETPVKVYNFPMKPWISISLQETDEQRPSFREEAILDIARLKKDFDQVDRNLVTASETYMAYGMSKAGGLRVIRQEDGKDAKLFTDTKDRIFNVSISTSPSNQHPKEAIIGTGVSGTVYWVQLKNGDRDHLEDAHPEQYGFALPPISASEGGDAPGGILKTRARSSSIHPEFFAVGRGKSINIIWPSFIFENNLFKQGHDRVVDTERLLKQCSLKINTGKAGKDFTFSQDDSLMVTLDKSGRVKFWDVRDLVAAKEGSDPSNPMPAQTSLEIKEPIMSLQTTPEGEKAWPTSVLLLDKYRPYQKQTAMRYMLVGMKQNHTLQLWDLALGKAVQEFNFPHIKESDAVCSVMYHAQSSMIVVGHPTRNSIYFLHLSAPKYTLKNLSQVQYIQRLEARDSSIPQPESTAVISGIREYSFANKGVLRSLNILENPSPSGDGDEPTLFELYAMHSKGVTCLFIKQGELGWSKDNKVISPVNAEEIGMATISKFVAIPPVQPAEPQAPADGTPAPIRIASRAKDSTKAEDRKDPESAGTPRPDRKDEVETPAPQQPERNERKGRKKKNANNASNDRDFAGPNGASDPNRSSQKTPARSNPRNDASSTALTNHLADLASAPNGLTQEQLEAVVASMESRMVANVTGRFDAVFNELVKRIQGFQDSRDSAFMSSQSTLLQMVSDVLNDNTETVLKNLIIDQINGNVIPSMRGVVEKTVTDQLAAKTGAQVNAVQKEVQKLLPTAVTQTMQRPEIVKLISDKVSHNVNAYMETQIAKSLENVASSVAKTTAHTVHQRVTADVSAQISDMFGRFEDRRRAEDEKLDRLIAQTTDLSNAISSLAATQAQTQHELAALKQQLQEQTRERERERELVVAEPVQTHARSRDSIGSHDKVNMAPRDYAPYQPQQYQQPQLQHPPIQQPQPPHIPQQHQSHVHAHRHFGGQDQEAFSPSTRGNQDSYELTKTMEVIDTMMNNNAYDEALLRWLQSGNDAEEIWQRVLSKCNAICVADLQPLLLLSVGATITNNFTRNTPKIMEKIHWLEVVVLSFNQMVPRLDDQVRAVTPKIMSMVKDRAEQLWVDLNRIAPNELLVKTLLNIAQIAGRIADNVQSHQSPSGHPVPSY